MSAVAEILADCDTYGIQLLPAGDDGLSIDAPRGALTPHLMERLKANKRELLATLRPEVDDPPIKPIVDGQFDHWIRLRRTDGGTSWIHPDHVVDDLEVIDPPDPCPECGSLLLWQSIVGNWRCQRCDPPKTAKRLHDVAKRLKMTASHRAGRTIGERHGV